MDLQRKKALGFPHPDSVISTSVRPGNVRDHNLPVQPLQSVPSLLTVVVVLLCGCGTYASLVLFLHIIPFSFSSEDPASMVNEIGQHLFGCSVVLFTLLLLCRGERQKQIVAVLVVFDNAIAFLSYHLMHHRAVPVVLNHFGQPSYPIRFIMWSHTIPAIIYLIAMISNYEAQKVARAMFGSIVMLTAGMMATYCPSQRCMLISLGLSVSLFVYTMVSMWYMLASAYRLAQKLMPQRTWPKLLQCLQVLLITTWTLFPMIWVLGALEWMTPHTEAYTYLLADISAKILFSAILLESNFISIEEAQRIAQEKRNRDVHIVRSITDEKRLEAELLYRSKYQQFASTSHEIRTPMNGIIGISDLLLTTNLTEEQQKYISTIRWSSNILLKLINDILTAAKSDNEELTVEEVRFSLREEIRMSTALFESLCITKQLATSYKIDEELPEYFIGAPASLRQVLINLLGNALKFTSKGRVDVFANLAQHTDLEPQQQGRESLELQAVQRRQEYKGNAVFVQVEVRDTGSGIPEEAKERIFEPFAQASDSISETYGGSGLGLHVCQLLVARMGGRIWFKSVLNKGSSFFFTMRLRPTELDPSLDVDTAADPSFRVEESGAESAMRTALARGGRGMHVLVAEDNDVNQMVVSSMLRMLRCTYEIVDNGDKAVRACCEASFDVVLMDCYMPGMDGFEATRQIRAYEQQQGRRTTIFALTASAIDQDHNKCLEAGMDLVLLKPIRLNDLARALMSA